MDNIFGLDFDELPNNAKIDTIKHLISQLDDYVALTIYSSDKPNSEKSKLINQHNRIIGQYESMTDKLIN